MLLEAYQLIPRLLGTSLERCQVLCWEACVTLRIPWLQSSNREELPGCDVITVSAMHAWASAAC
jgi:hypothetical protein